MPLKRCVTLLVLVLCAAFPLSAATVSFIVIETGLNMDAGANQYSGLWESGLLDVFFENGHIVSNAPVLRLENTPSEAFPEQARKELAEAAEGGAVFLITALLEYQIPGSAAREKPQRIILRVFSMSPFKMLYVQSLPASNSQSVREEFENIKKAARTLLPHLK